MFKKAILVAATVAVGLVAFQPAAQAHGLKIQVGGGHHGGQWGGQWGGHWGGHGGHGHWGGHGHGHGHGGFSCFYKYKKVWHKGHGHFHKKKYKVCF